MTKIVISGYYGYKNFGDEAILSVIVSHLKPKSAEVTVLSGDPEYTKNKDNVNAINRFDIKQVVKAIKDSDVLISGGGSLLQDVTSLKSLIYYLFIIAMGILYNKKVVIFAQGIGPINNLFAKMITKLVLKQCFYISVRDRKSFELLKSWDIPSEIVSDPVYSVVINNFNKNLNVGIQLRNCKSMNKFLLQRLALLVNSKYSDRHIELYSLQNEIDYDVCKAFENVLHSINPNIQTEIVSENIIDRIKNIDTLIGMRFHSLLIALKAGVKCCAINYDIKVEQLANETGIPIISMDASENFELIYDKLQNLNTQDILRIVNTKTFDWSKFDEILGF